jgi:hypothetical protein
MRREEGRSYGGIERGERPVSGHARLEAVRRPVGALQRKDCMIEGAAKEDSGPEKEAAPTAIHLRIVAALLSQ